MNAIIEATKPSLDHPTYRYGGSALIAPALIAHAGDDAAWRLLVHRRHRHPAGMDLPTYQKTAEKNRQEHMMCTHETTFVFSTA